MGGPALGAPAQSHETGAVVTAVLGSSRLATVVRVLLLRRVPSMAAPMKDTGIRLLNAAGFVVISTFQRDGQQYFVVRERRQQELLTARERQVLIRASRGESNKVIAYELGLSWSTVRVLIYRAVKKLGGRRRADAIRKFCQLTELEGADDGMSAADKAPLGVEQRS